MILDLVLWGSIGLLAYAWGVYPLLIVAVAPRQRRPPVVTPSCKTAAILVSAHNEERVIEARLQNLLDCALGAGGGEPPRYTIYLGVDGAGDKTLEVARAYAARHAFIRVHDVPVRRGKTAMLRDLAAMGREELLVFTDANTLFERDALTILLARFSDPEVGGVCGRLVFSERPQAQTREREYWNWEGILKRKESALDSCLGANGAIYAIRRELFWEAIPVNTIVDDFVIGMKVREQGYRMIYEPDAVAREEAPHRIKHEWKRRVRIGAGAYQALWLCRKCLLPRYGRFAWMFFSHKVLRWFSPHLLLALFAVSLGLLIRGTDGIRTDRGLIGVLALLFLTAAVIGRLLRGSSAAVARPFQLCAYFLAMQAALFQGFLRFCRGDLSGAWQRTAR